MYRLLVVDDQSVIREGLVAYFQGGELGFTVDAAFEDGEDAIEYLKKHYENIDVVLTDIKMARVSGLEIARYISEKKWNIKTVLLSSYREFEYAQKV